MTIASPFTVEKMPPAPTILECLTRANSPCSRRACSRDRRRWLRNFTATSRPVNSSWHRRTTLKRPRPNSSSSIYSFSKFVLTTAVVLAAMMPLPLRIAEVSPPTVLCRTFTSAECGMSTRGIVRGGEGREGSESGVLLLGEYDTTRKLYVSPKSKFEFIHVF